MLNVHIDHIDNTYRIQSTIDLTTDNTVRSIENSHEEQGDPAERWKERNSDQ